MSDDPKIEPYYRKQAQWFIDMLFDKGYFDRDTTREDMRQAEELLAYQFQSQAETAASGERLLRRVREKV